MSPSSELAVGKLDAVTFDTFLAQQAPFEAEDCRLDLGGYRLITPAALVGLTVACHALARAGRRPTVLVADPDVRSYLLRSCFLEAVAPVATIVPPVSAGLSRPARTFRGNNPLLIEVTGYEKGEALSGLLDRVVAALRAELSYGKHDAYDVAIAVSEVAQNSLEHSRRPRGFLAMQAYRRGPGLFLEVGLGDDGDGLAETLRHNPKNRPVASDLAAIRLATRLRVSEHDDRTRGTGLPHLLEITRRHAGTVQIRSGEAKVRYRMDTGREWAIGVPFLPGVQVSLTLDAKRMGRG